MDFEELRNRTASVTKVAKDAAEKIGILIHEKPINYPQLKAVLEILTKYRALLFELDQEIIKTSQPKPNPIANPNIYNYNLGNIPNAFNPPVSIPKANFDGYLKSAFERDLFLGETILKAQELVADCDGKNKSPPPETSDEPQCKRNPGDLQLIKKKLLSMENSDSGLMTLMKFRVACKSHLRALKDCGIDIDEKLYTAADVMMSKLPKHIVEKMNKKTNSVYWTVDRFWEAFETEVDHLAACELKTKDEAASLKKDGSYTPV